MSDYLATTLIVEAGKKVQTIHLDRGLTLAEIHNYFYRRTGRKCISTMSKGIARVTF